jgi:glutamine synthetase
MGLPAAVKQVVMDTLSKHYRVLFNGDGYSAAWVKEAATRGLLNLASTPKALLAVDQVELYKRANCMSRNEVEARVNVTLENYIKNKAIEARCMVKMATQYFVPAANAALARMGASQAVCKVAQVQKNIDRIGVLVGKILDEQSNIKRLMAHEESDIGKEATAYDEKVSPAVDLMREAADELEDFCTQDEWKLPTYQDLLFVQCPAE